jgi:hypothetical protein
MGIPLSEFPELDPNWVEGELSKEDIQLKKEEQDEGEWDSEAGGLYRLELNDLLTKIDRT